MNISTTGDDLFDRRFDTLEKEFKDSLTKKQDLSRFKTLRLLASEMTKRLVNEKNFNSPWIMIRDDDVDPDMTVLVKTVSDKEYEPCLLTERKPDMLSISIVPEHFEINCEIGITGCIRITVMGEIAFNIQFNDAVFSPSNKHYRFFCDTLNDSFVEVDKMLKDEDVNNDES